MAVVSYVPTLRSHKWVNNNMRLITNISHHFTVMKNCTTPNYAQTWVTKTVNHHSTYPDFFASSYHAKACE